MKKRPTQSRKGVKGGFPLAGSRGGAPLWGLGQRPNRSTGDHSKGITNKGAGSEASLPVTLRVLRRAPKPHIRPLAYCRAKWARPSCWCRRHSGAVKQACFLPQAGDFASAEATRGQWKRMKFAVAPLTPSPCTFSYLIFIVAGGNRACGRDQRGFRSPFGNLRCTPLLLDFYRKFLVCALNHQYHQ